MQFSKEYRKYCNKRGTDWWSIVFGYPVGRFLLVFAGEWKWVTPNRLTVLGFMLNVAAALLFLAQQFWIDVIAVVALQVNTVLDTMDGSLARLRGTSSRVGAFLDKISDGVGLFLLFTAVGFRADRIWGTGYYVVVGATAGAAYLVLCYMFWVRRHFDPPGPGGITGAVEPPTFAERRGEWVRGWLQIVRFNQADMFFWVSLGAMLNLWREAVILAAATQIIAFFKRFVEHLLFLRKMDRADSGE